jgi:raffinose/stachyose/melibiose transport system permease protein
MHKVLSNKKVIFILVFPGVLIFMFAILVPIVLSAYYGMTSYSGIGTPRFIGMKNFISILTEDKVFWISLRNALMLGVCYIIFQHPFCILTAIIIDKIGGNLEKVFRAILFIPCVISIVITCKMWVGILDSQYGLLNKILDSVGLGILKHEWLGDPKIALGSITFMIIWQGFGWGMLFYYAGLKGIPEELYEAAKIDGASVLKTHIRITLPLLAPVIRIQFTLAVIAALKQMESIFLTTNGGPSDKTQFLANYLYTKAFNYQQYGYANAISVLFVIVCLITTISLNKLVRNQEI